MRMPRIMAILLIGLLIILAACAKPVPSSTPTQPPTEPPPIPTTTAQILIVPRADAGEILGVVQLSSPIVTVPVGTMVTWNNTDGGEYTIISNDGFFNKHLKYGESFSYVFTKRGDFIYYAEPAGLRGWVIVE